ncbi:MAG: cyclic nucleotide-binding domain-containing protein [Spirochaetales bacterium]|nr:cyclic nucleotide-binding domain-containing protein [Spirochaetales bacterium]HNQ96481.1 cyclic nucleotide-binding domain-containing protein [Treponemataceae bacterium]
MLQLAFVNFRKGSYILVEGKVESDRFYIIQGGKVQITKDTEVVAEEGGNILGPGDFIGVVSSMSGHSQIETAMAITDVTLISVRRDQFSELIEKNTPVAMKIIYSFTRKMRYLDEALTRITLKKNVESDITHLFNIGEYYAKLSKYNLALYAYYHYLKNAPNGPYAAVARERFMALKSMGVSVTTACLEPKPGEMTRLYTEETIVFCECQPGAELYIIQKGQVKITKIVDKNEVLLAVLKAGDMFGEMALLENKPRSASAIALEGTQLLAVNRQNFNQMVSTQPQLIARLTTTLADRIWLMYKQLANTLITDPIGRMYDMLVIQLEKSKIPFQTARSYTFDFGPNELANMCGIVKEDAQRVISEFMREPIVRLTDERISVADMSELSKQNAYRKKLMDLERARNESRSGGATTNSVVLW